MVRAATSSTSASAAAAEQQRRIALQRAEAERRAAEAKRRAAEQAQQQAQAAHARAVTQPHATHDRTPSTAGSNGAPTRTPSTTGLRRSPFALADRVGDVFDPHSLDARSGATPLAPRPGASPEEVAAIDAHKVELATAVSPENGASMLRMHMERGEDPRYRRALANAALPAVESMGHQLANDDRVTPEAARSTARDLAAAADLAGPSSSRALADAFARPMPTELVGDRGRKVTAAIEATAEHDSGVRFGRDFAESLSRTGKYEAADQIAHLSRELAPGGLDRGEQRARDSIQVDEASVTAERDRLSSDLDGVDRRTRDAVDRTFARATEKLPHGASVVASSPNEIAIERRDRQGRLLWQEHATRDGDRVTWQRTDWRDGVADRKTLATGGDEGTLARRETWRAPLARDPAQPTTDDLKSQSVCDPSVTVHEESVRRDGEALVRREGTWDAHGRSEVEKTYRTQTGKDGIEETVGEDFDDDRTTSVVETSRTDQPRGEAEHHVEEVSYSQGNLRATSAVGTNTDGDETPKQWTLEKQLGNEYRAQTFVEGVPDVSTVTTRRAEGRTVEEHTEARGLDDDGDAITSTSSTKTRFDSGGIVAAKDAELVDEDGVRTTQRFRREEERTDRGLEITERTQTRREEPGDPPDVWTSDRRVRSLYDGRSTRLLSTNETLDGPTGQATSTIDERGPRLVVNGRPVPLAEGSAAFDRLRGEERDLGAQATADTFRDVKRFGQLGMSALSLVSVGKGVPDAGYDSRLAPATRERIDGRLDTLNRRLTDRFGEDRMENAFRAHTAGMSGAKGVLGLAGLAASGFALSNDLEHFGPSHPEALFDVGNGATSGAQIVSAARELRAIHAGAPAEDVAAAAGRFGTFARFGGITTGVAAGGFQIYQGIDGGDGVQIAQGGVTIAGAVGGFAAAGAIGGPLGVAAGAGVGLVAFGISEGIGAIFGDDEPNVAEKVI